MKRFCFLCALTFSCLLAAVGTETAAPAESQTDPHPRPQPTTRSQTQTQTQVQVQVQTMQTQQPTQTMPANTSSLMQPRIAIPAPLEKRFAHLSWPKVIRAANGDLVAAFIAGTFHGTHGGGCPAVSRSTDNGLTWSSPHILIEFAPGKEYTQSGNLALGAAADGTLVLLAMAYDAEKANAIFGWRSHDNGLTWQQDVDVSALGPNKTGSVFGRILEVPGAGTEGRDGGGDGRSDGTASSGGGSGRGSDGRSAPVLMVLGHYRRGSAPYVQGIWLSTSVDTGKTWSAPRRISDVYAVEPVLVRTTAGRLIAFLRGETGPSRGRQSLAISDDAGKTWRTELSQLDSRDPSRSRLVAPFAMEDPHKPGSLLVLTTERSLKGETPGCIWLWRGDATTLQFHRERVLLNFPRIAPAQPGSSNNEAAARNTDFGYPWLLPLNPSSSPSDTTSGATSPDPRLLMLYYHGEMHGPSPIWGVEITP